MLGRETRRAVFLDRDGVLNAPVVKLGKSYPPGSLEEMQVLPGAVEACRALKAVGFLLLGATNQPDIARGTTSAAAVDRINQFLRLHLELDGILTCPHDDGDACDCRKPKPGLLLAAAKLHDIDLSASFMVGDRWRDIEAGVSAGCRTVFIDWSYSERRPEQPDLTVRSLLEAVPWILKTSHSL